MGFLQPLLTSGITACFVLTGLDKIDHPQSQPFPPPEYTPSKRGFLGDLHDLGYRWSSRL